MPTILKTTVAVLSALAVAVPASAQQQRGQQPGAQPTRLAPPPPSTGSSLTADLAFGNIDGQVTVVADPMTGQLCYMFYGPEVAGASAAHIHDTAGNTVATLRPPVNGSASGCTPLASNLIQGLIRNPQGYYVDVHTRDLPNGQIRGALAR